MEQLNDYLKSLLSTASYELHLEPNKNPFVVSANGPSDISNKPLQGTQISMMVFPLIPQDVKNELPHQPHIEFVHPHNLGKFSFKVQKSPAGFNVTVKPVFGDVEGEEEQGKALPPNDFNGTSTEPDTYPGAPENLASSFENPVIAPAATKIEFDLPIEQPTVPIADPSIDILSANDPQYTTIFSEPVAEEKTSTDEAFIPQPDIPLKSSESEPAADVPVPAEPVLADRRTGERRRSNTVMNGRMDALFNLMSEVGASDLHMSVSLPPMVRKDGKMQPLECSEETLTPEVMRELLHSIMPEKNQEEFERRRDTDFAYEIPDLARFRCNVFMDRKGMGGVFRIIPTKILTAEQLGLSKAIMDLCSLSKGLVVVTGPTGSGKSTTLCAMVDSINKVREDHIITIEDPIEFVHENQKCLVNQREVHNHTDSFKDALRAALREDPDILLVGEMRDLETISIAIETAETGHLVFGTLHTTTAASTVDRIIDQFPADRQQQIRVMLSESLKGVIAQTLLPKIGGGRVAALEVLIVTPAISNLIREGKTFQIPSAMQTGKTHGMVMLNDALFDLVEKKIVEPRDAYIKAVDKTNFETMLTRGGFKI
ncbi:MAG: type IV pilus twitching motility protein PilT [Blastocatellia bacterium]